ncbi:hypothetical protein AVEN_78188-1 [Araneus ventricosus]|uniref:Uncharacterized protein n=1 Tax=Araneus ventricosus TaxID=182803 RepID=A0A4Y2MSM2_ARAVE|nr:hypothetical protein AVEN_78188-1 [Araneus ventricosus]
MLPNGRRLFCSNDFYSTPPASNPPFPRKYQNSEPPSFLPLAQTIPENHHVSASSSFLPFTSSGHSLPERARTGFIKKQISEVDLSVFRLATCGRQYFKLCF